MVYNEAETRINLIDPKLEAAGGIIQDRRDMNLFAPEVLVKEIANDLEVELE